MLRLAAILLFFLCASACSTTGGAQNLAPPSFTAAEAQATQSNEAAHVSRYLVKEADISLEVESIDTVVSDLKASLERLQGYVDRSEQRNERTIDITAKVPSEKFDTFISAIGKSGIITNKSVRVKDITDQVIDTGARLKSMKALRSRMEALLNKTLDIGQILQIEKEITRLQGEIERIEGRLNSLKKQAAMSEVNISISKKRVLGPLSYIGVGVYWVFEKLFIIE